MCTPEKSGASQRFCALECARSDRHRARNLCRPDRRISLRNPVVKHLIISKIMIMKKEIEYLKSELMRKKIISNLIGSCKNSSGSLQDNSLPWLLTDKSSENINFILDTTPKCLNLTTPTQSMLK